MELDKSKIVSPSTYNIYDKGYRTGAQTSIFIGPIWVEEVMSLQLNTSSNDLPVYSYSNPYYDRVMLGKYIVTGQIGIAYTEPDYLLRIIQKAQNETIQGDELYQLIEQRKSIFANTVKYRLLTEKALQQGGITKEFLTDESLNSEAYLTKYIYSYVDRITREIETSNLRNGKLDPLLFELTVIRGNVYDDTQSIEIYEGVKINGTTSVVINDDNSLLEIYQFTGRKKPDREHRTLITPPAGVLSKSNLMQMAREVTERLVESLLDSPTIDVYENTRRTSLMVNSEKIAPAGPLNLNATHYGKGASFGELTFALRYNGRFTRFPTTDGSDGPIQSVTPLAVYNESSHQQIATGENIYLVPPEGKDGSSTYFDNSHGKIVHPDRAGTADKISAVGPVYPAVLTEMMGGSIVLPRYRRNEYDIGHFVPPQVRLDLTDFTYADTDLPAYTATTLWTCLVGMRNTPSMSNENINAEEEETSDSRYIAEVTQPFFSYAYVEKVSAEWDESTEGVIKLGIAEPVYVDFKELNHPPKQASAKEESDTSSPPNAAVAQDEFALGKYENDIVFTYQKAGSSVSFEGAYRVSKDSNLEVSDGDETIDLSATILHTTVTLHDLAELDGDPDQWEAGHSYVTSPTADIVCYGPLAYRCTSDHTSSATFADDAGNWEYIGEWFNPRLFELTPSISDSALVADFNKCTHIVPFVFFEDGAMENFVEWPVEEGAPEAGCWKVDWTDSDLPSDTTAQLIYFLSENDGADDGCNVEFAYHWTVTSNSGYTEVGQPITIKGVYFINKKGDMFDKVYTGTEWVDRSKVYKSEDDSAIPTEPTVHVYWLATVLPIKRASSTEENKKEKIKTLHDLDGDCGRILEVYNITRCDITRISRTKWYAFNPQNTTSQAIMNSLTYAFDEMVSMFTDTNYHWPVTDRMSYIAGFLRGYSFRINTNRITDQVLKCTFNTMSPLVKLKQSTFECALALALSDQDLKQDNPEQPIYLKGGEGSPLTPLTYSEVGSMVRQVLKERANRKGMKILGETTSDGVVTIYTDVMTPAPDVVAWGLSEEGYTTLYNIMQENESTEHGVSEAIELGGYTV